MKEEKGRRKEIENGIIGIRFHTVNNYPIKYDR